MNTDGKGFIYKDFGPDRRAMIMPTFYGARIGVGHPEDEGFADIW